MSDTPTDETRSTAISQLKTLGLSTYAARTLVALVSLGGGTAQDVSEVADVPRTRVYDAVEELESEGLVDVQHSTPREFWPISTETTGRQFKREYEHRVDVLTDALDTLGTVERPREQRGVWTVTGQETVTERVIEFVDSADEEIVYMTVEALLSNRLEERLAAASDRGVSIRLAGMSPATGSRLRERLPEAESFDSLWDWSDTPAGRLLMVDRERTLVSVLAPGDGSYPLEHRDETAIWGKGSTNGLVLVLKMLFTWQLDEGRD
ncbi:TrmB family transcriptional regulator [Halobacteriales archaeon QS_4_70_19]|nr:MAG: TrmB family transcriptional regulator [Halobacteriales archaeon QS_4_70_19]